MVTLHILYKQHNHFQFVHSVRIDVVCSKDEILAQLLLFGELFCYVQQDAYVAYLA